MTLRQACFSPFLLAVTLPLLLLLLHCYFFYPFLIDDTFIPLRYVQRLLEGKGLTWNDGEYVEGYSSFLWVLLTAGLGALGIDLLWACRLLSMGFTLITMGALAYYGRMIAAKPIAIFFGLLVFSATASVSIWAVGGLEGPLVMCLLSWAFISADSLLTGKSVARTVLAALLLGLICWTRPEGPIYCLAMAAGLWATSAMPKPEKIRTLFLICGIPFLFFIAQTGFRYVYYGQFVSNSVLAKSAFSLRYLLIGLLYIVTGFLAFSIPLIYSARAYGASVQPHRRRLRFAAIIIGIYFLYLLLSGGDIYQGFRFFIPVMGIIVMMFMAAVAVRIQIRPLQKEITLLVLLVASYFLINTNFYWTHGATQMQAWVFNAAEMGKALREKYGKENPLVAAGAAGAIPYYSGLRSLDVFGLNDAYLTAHRHSNPYFGTTIPGHDLFDGDYVMSRKPDIIVKDVPGNAHSQKLCEVFPCDEYLKDYAPHALAIPGYSATIWIRKDSPLSARQ